MNKEQLHEELLSMGFTLDDNGGTWNLYQKDNIEVRSFSKLTYVCLNYNSRSHVSKQYLFSELESFHDSKALLTDFFDGVEELGINIQKYRI